MWCDGHPRTRWDRVPVRENRRMSRFCAAINAPVAPDLRGGDADAGPSGRQMNVNVKW